MPADKRLSPISGHIKPSLCHREKYRQSLLDNLRRVSIVQLHVCTSAIPYKAISELFIALRKMVYLISEVEDSISNQWATLLNWRSMFTAFGIQFLIEVRRQFSKIVGIYVIEIPARVDEHSQVSSKSHAKKWHQCWNQLAYWPTHGRWTNKSEFCGVCWMLQVSFTMFLKTGVTSFTRISSI